MNGGCLLDKALYSGPKNLYCDKSGEQMSSKQQPRIEYGVNLISEGHSAEESSRRVQNRCDILSSSLSNVNTRQAFKNRAGKLSQTLSNVRTTFGVLSQRIKKSTKKKQPLINMESPRSPSTPYARSRAVLGRTPTKLYSPFGIDTPSGKENQSKRSVKCGNHSNNLGVNDGKKYLRRTKLDLGARSNALKEAMSPKDHFQMQISNYEFQTVAK